MALSQAMVCAIGEVRERLNRRSQEDCRLGIPAVGSNPTLSANQSADITDADMPWSHRLTCEDAGLQVGNMGSTPIGTTR